MGIIPLGQLYPRAIAGCAAPAFGNDQQGCGELRAIGQRHAHAAIAHLGCGDFSGHVQMDFRAGLYCIEKQLADQPILDHLAQIAVALFGNEIQRAGFQLVAHPYLFDRASLAVQRIAKADGRE